MPQKWPKVENLYLLGTFVAIATKWHMLLLAIFVLVKGYGGNGETPRGVEGKEMGGKEERR